MGSEIERKQTFEEKVKGRIRDSIGDLITDDDLGRLVERGAEELFFKPRIERSDYGRTIEHPPLVHECVKELLSERMDAALDRYLEQNKETVEKIITRMIEDGGLGAITRALSRVIEQPLFDASAAMTHNIEQRIANLESRP
ncbi:hypothetical protein [Zhongshania sp.]|uniref:hypothetical protein n=1 Tax=Zhongshania sp. TaxID=1971902 RepID=UPI0035693180